MSNQQSVNFTCPVCGTKKNRIIAELNSEGTVNRCGNCGLIFLLPLPSREYLREYFENKYITNFKKELVSHAKPTEEYRKFMAPINRLRQSVITKYCEGSAILHIGCSYGLLLDSFKKTGWNVFGVEPGKSFCQFAKSSGIPVKEGFFEEISDDYPEDYFDVIVLSHVLHMVPDPKIILQLASKKLKRNGMIYIELPNTIFSYQTSLANFANKILLKPTRQPFGMPLLYYYTPRSLNALLNKTGFKTVSLETINRHHECLEKYVARFINHEPGKKFFKLLMPGIRYIFRIANFFSLIKLVDNSVCLLNRGATMYAVGKKRL